jgi:serine/threonine-protein kinase RIO1
MLKNLVLATAEPEHPDLSEYNIFVSQWKNYIINIKHPNSKQFLSRYIAIINSFLKNGDFKYGSAVEQISRWK